MTLTHHTIYLNPSELKIQKVDPSSQIKQVLNMTQGDRSFKEVHIVDDGNLKESRTVGQSSRKFRHLTDRRHVIPCTTTKPPTMT